MWTDSLGDRLDKTAVIHCVWTESRGQYGYKRSTSARGACESGNEVRVSDRDILCDCVDAKSTSACIMAFILWGTAGKETWCIYTNLFDGFYVNCSTDVCESEVTGRGCGSAMLDYTVLNENWCSSSNAGNGLAMDSQSTYSTHRMWIRKKKIFRCSSLSHSDNLHTQLCVSLWECIQ